MQSSDLKRPAWLALFAIAASAAWPQGFAGEGLAAERKPRLTTGETTLPGTIPASTVETEIVQKDLLDLAKRIGVSNNEIVSVREVSWRNGSIGCPSPGMAYKQMLVNGSRIVLRAGGKDYHYHGGGGRGPFHCADPAEPLPTDAS